MKAYAAVLFILLQGRDRNLIVVLCGCSMWESFQTLQDIPHCWTGLWFILGAVLYQICKFLWGLLRHSAQKEMRGVDWSCAKW